MMKQQIIEGCFLLVPFCEYMNSSCGYTLGDRKAVEYCVGAYELAVIWRLTACREVYDRLVILKDTHLQVHVFMERNMKWTKNDKLILGIIESEGNLISSMTEVMKDQCICVDADSFGLSINSESILSVGCGVGF